MFKKLLAGALALAMTFSLSAVTFAQDTISIDCQLSEGDAVNVGDVFYADFKITDNPSGYCSMQCYVDFDSSKLQALECDVEDIPNDLIIYTDANGVNYSIFSYTHVNSRINFVPTNGDNEYLGKADSKTTAGEIGRIKCANLINDVIDGERVNYQGTGTVLRMKFKAIAPGVSEISMNDVRGAHTDAENGSQDLDFSVNNASITIDGDVPDPVTEATTSAAVTTTKAQNGNTSSGGSSGSSVKTTTTEATTAESTTESTTEAVIGGSDTETNIKVISFTDVEDSFWAHNYIINLAGKGVVNGYPDGSFKPQNNVTRADFLIMLLRGLGVDISKKADGLSGFTDVDKDAYYASACAIAKDMGIASGNPDGSFNPTGFITRQDMMILAKKAVENKVGTEIKGNSSVLDKFKDKDSISAYAADSLSAMVEAGIVNGKGDDIAPKANTTRAESATIISKLMNYVSK